MNRLDAWPMNVQGAKVVGLAVAVVAGLVFWDSPFLWPLKMLVVMIHETGHAAASLLVGGAVKEVTIAADQSGLCLSAIPPGFIPRVVVYSAGYVGSALMGAVLLVWTLRLGGGRCLLGAAAAWLLCMALLYAGDGFTLLFCLGTSAALALGARFAPSVAIRGFNLLLAAFCSLYAVMDLRDDLWNSAVRARSDAALLSELTFIPALVWALLWSLFSLALVAVGLWLAVRAKRAPTARPAPAP